MPPIVDPKELPGYKEAETDYRIAVRDAGDDELAKAKAQVAWGEKQRDFDRQMHAHNESERAMNEAKAKIAADFPDVPEAIYAAAADPEAMIAAAQLFHDTLQEKIGTPAGSEQPAGAATPGQPPVGAGAGVPVPSGMKADYQKAVDEFNSPEAQKNAYMRKQAAEKINNIGMNAIVAPTLRYARAEAQKQSR